MVKHKKSSSKKRASLRGRLIFKRKLVAWLAIVLIGFGGVALTLFSSAATPTGTLDIITYDGPRATRQVCTGPTRVPMRRFINPWFASGQDHFYTIDRNFANGTNGYAEENGAAWYTYSYNADGTTPWMRAWNGEPVNNHYYTWKIPDLQAAAAFGWQYEGAEGRVSVDQKPGTIPLYHVYHPGINDHLYSTDLGEMWGALGAGYGYFADNPDNFVAAYVWPDDGNSCTTVTGGNEIGNVYVVTDHGGSGVQCSPRAGKTDAVDGSNHGHLHLTCPAANDGGPRTYRFVSAGRDGFGLHPDTPHKPGDTFHISAGQTNTFSIFMQRGGTPSGPSEPSSGGGGGSSGGSSGGSTGGAQPTAGGGPSSGGSQPAGGSPSSSQSDKNGALQITAYRLGFDGTRTKLGNVKIVAQAVGFGISDTNHGCADNSRTTDGNGSPASNGNYGQTHFTNCWTGSDGRKAYQLNSVEIPRGLSFRSLVITGPSGSKFLSGSSRADDINEKFNLFPDKEIKLELLMAQDGPDDVKQVVTKSGTHYIAVDNSQSSKQAAQAMNTFGNRPVDIAGITKATCNDDDEDEDNDCPPDTSPPSRPSNFRAVQDGSGSIALSWDASIGDPVGEEITYYIERIDKDSPDDAEDVGDDVISSLHVLDVADNLEYPKNYIYQIYAEDDEANPSEIATTEITTTPPEGFVTVTPDTNTESNPPDNNPASVTGEPSVDDNADIDEDVTSIESDDGDALLLMSDEALEDDEELACSVSDSDSSGDEMLADIGTVVGEKYTPVCREEDGDTDDEFEDDVDFSIEADEDELTDDTELYGYDGTDWEEIPTSFVSEKTGAKKQNPKGVLKYSSAKKYRFKTAAANKKGDTKITYTVSTNKLFAVALVDKKSQPPAFLKPVLSITLLGLAIFGARLIMRRQLGFEPNNEYPYGDIDLRPMQPHEAPPQFAQPPPDIPPTLEDKDE